MKIYVRHSPEIDYDPAASPPGFENFRRTIDLLRRPVCGGESGVLLADKGGNARLYELLASPNPDVIRPVDPEEIAGGVHRIHRAC